MSNEEQKKVTEEVQKIVDEKGAEFEACLLKALQISENIEGVKPKSKFRDEQVTTWAQSLFNDIGRDQRTKAIDASKQKNGGGNRFSRSSYTPKPGGYTASNGTGNGNGNGNGNGHGNTAVAPVTRSAFTGQVGEGLATEKQINALLRFVSLDAQKAGKTPETFLEEYLGKPLGEVSKREASAAFDKLKN